MTREEVIRLAKNYCDYSSDSKGRESFEFDDYGLYFFAELVAAEYKRDAERYRWLRSEHDRIDPVAAVVWKKGFDRSSSDWVNTIDGKWLDADIDRAKGDSK